MVCSYEQSCCQLSTWGIHACSNAELTGFMSIASAGPRWNGQLTGDEYKKHAILYSDVPPTCS